MQWYSILAIYFLLWILSLFLVLPFYAKTHDELGIDRVPGQADSAPGHFRPLRIILWTSLVATVPFVLFYLNYVNGWVGSELFEALGRS